MESNIQFICFRQLGSAPGIVNENHGTDTRDTSPSIAFEGGIRFSHRTAPVVRVND